MGAARAEGSRAPTGLPLDLYGGLHVLLQLTKESETADVEHLGRETVSDSRR